MRETVKERIMLFLVSLAVIAAIFLILLVPMFWDEIRSMPDYDRIYRDIGVKQGEKIKPVLVVQGAPLDHKQRKTVEAAFKAVANSDYVCEDGRYYLEKVIFKSKDTNIDPDARRISFSTQYYFAKRDYSREDTDGWGPDEYSRVTGKVIDVVKDTETGEWHARELGCG